MASASPVDTFRGIEWSSERGERNDPVDAWQKARRLGRRFGLVIYETDLRAKVALDEGWFADPHGRRLNQFTGGSSIAANSPSNAIHDIAHFQVCSPARRKMKDFGLGRGPDSVTHAPDLLKDPECGREEQRASLLGILWEIEFGLDWQDTTFEHSWEQSSRDVGVVLRWLREQGLVVDGHPRVRRRKSPDQLRNLVAEKH